MQEAAVQRLIENLLGMIIDDLSLFPATQSEHQKHNQGHTSFMVK